MTSQAEALGESLLEGVDKGTPDIILNLLQGLGAAGYSARKGEHSIPGIRRLS